jgi:hypothetical protein
LSQLSNLNSKTAATAKQIKRETMPISVTDLLTQTELSADELKTVQWGIMPTSSEIGIYIISI